VPVDFRYHLTSLIAVFLALALGLLLGSNFIGGSSIEKQVAKSLERQFSQLREENRRQQESIEELRERLKKSEEFERGVLPSLVDKRLSWRRVAIVQTGDYSEAVQNAKSALEAAGARVTSVTTIPNLSGRSALERANRAVELITSESGVLDPITRVVQIVGNCIVTGSNPEAMEILEKEGLVTTSGDYNRRVSAVVVVGGGSVQNEKRALTVDLPLLEALKSQNVVVIGCEPLYAGYSYIPTYQKKQISTIDNIDTPMGQVALVFAVLEDTGNFGLKDSADRILPKYFENRR